LVFGSFCDDLAEHPSRELLHDAPSCMTLPFVVFAIGALIAGYIGRPGVFGGSQFAHWLEPVVGAHVEEQPNHALELGLMAVSISVAAFGFLVAYLMYYRGALSPETFAKLAGGFFYRLFDR